MKSSCREIRERLVAYADGEIDPRERQALETHLRCCDACAAELEELGTLRALARGLPELPSEPHDRQAIVRAAQGRIEPWPRPGIFSRLRSADLITVGAVAAGVAFAILIRADRRPALPRSLEALTVAELDARKTGAPLAETELHLESIDGRGSELPREEIR